MKKRRAERRIPKNRKAAPKDDSPANHFFHSNTPGVFSVKPDLKLCVPKS